MTTSDTSADELAAFAAAFNAGERAFWTGDHDAFDGASADWKLGYLTAAREAGNVASEHRQLLKHAGAVRGTLIEAGHVLRQVRSTWVKQPAGIGARIAGAQLQINTLLVELGWTADRRAEPAAITPAEAG